MRAKGGGERMVARGEGGDGGGIKKKGKDEKEKIGLFYPI